VESHTVIATGEDIDALPPLSEQNMLECTPNKEDCGGEFFMLQIMTDPLAHLGVDDHYPDACFINYIHISISFYRYWRM